MLFPELDTLERRQVQCMHCIYVSIQCPSLILEKMNQNCFYKDYTDYMVLNYGLKIP